MHVSLLKITTALGFTLGLSSLLLSSTLHAQNFYKWVDKAGSTHYTLTPPPANAHKVSKIATYNDRATNQDNGTPATATEQASIPSAAEAAAKAAEASTQQTANEFGRIPLPPQTDANPQ